MVAKSSFVSLEVSEVVGSSKMTIRAFIASTFAISTSCRSPGESVSTRVLGGVSSPTSESSSRVRTAIAPRSRNGR